MSKYILALAIIIALVCPITAHSGEHQERFKVGDTWQKGGENYVVQT